MSRAPAIAVPAAAWRLLRPLAEEARSRGVALYAVGGCVRDWMLRRPTFDLDVTVEGDPDPTAALCARLLKGEAEPFGRFGTRRVIGRGRLRVDVATTRSESYAEPAALPELTAVGVPIEADLFRRDFTVNAMALRLDDGSRALVDPYGGRRDLGKRVLRALHPASFRDDPTRVFRAARFLARLRARPADGMEEQAREALRAGWAGKLSRHRLLHELDALLGEKDPRRALRILEGWGYLALLHPSLPWRRPLPAGREPRLHALALALGAEAGKDFVASFPFEHALRGRLLESLSLAFSDKAPRNPPSAEAAAAVRRHDPRMKPAALRACFLQGRDLIAAGLTPGPRFHEILDEAARLQRRGELGSASAARAWLLSQNRQ